MAVNRNDRRIDCYIPANYENNFNVSGFSFKNRNIAEALIFGTTLGIGTFYLTYNVIYFTLQVSIYITLAVTVGIAALCINGINGDCFTRHIKHMIQSAFRRRTAIYNERVKLEAQPYIDTYVEEEKVLPREKINALFREYKNKLNISKDQKITEEEFVEGEYVFIDDIDNAPKQPSIFARLFGGKKNERKEEKE